MFEDGIVKVRQRGFDPETSMYCFGGGGGGGGGGSKSPDPTRQAGQNTRVDSRGNTVNFNTKPAEVQSTPTFTKTLPSGVEVVDFSRPFQGQVNLSNRATPLGQALPSPSQSMFDNFTQALPSVDVPNIGNLSPQDLSLMNVINPTISAPTTPAEAFNQALQAGQFGDGRVGLGGGFSFGRVPGGVGFQFDRAFSEGGAVNSGIGSLLRSTKS